MKKLLIILFVLLVLSGCGQTLIEKDSVLKKIQSKLPNGWAMKINDTVLSIERNDPVMIKHYMNHINENPDVEKPTDEELKKSFGKSPKEKYKITYKIEPKWSETKLNQAKIYNDSISDAVNKLWDKYKLEKHHSHVSPSGNSKADYDRRIYEPKSRRLKKYWAEREQLEKMKIIIPDKCTENYSLFPQKNFYDDDDDVRSTDVYPESAYYEGQKVEETIWKHCGNKN